MGLYKICEHEGRARDRCEHVWWGSFRGVRVSLAKWTNREIHNKAEAGGALDEMRTAIRNGTFDERGLEPPRDVTTLTFREFADIFKQRHVQAKRLAIAKTIDYRLTRATWSAQKNVTMTVTKFQVFFKIRRKSGRSTKRKPILKRNLTRSVRTI
jgi:hypothetical protein